MQKLLISFLLIFLLLIGCNQNESKKEAIEDQKIKIGISLPLTGEASIYGKAMKNGILLAYDTLKNKDKIELVFKDDKGKAQHSINAINSLLLNNIDVVIGGAQTKTAEPILPILEKKQILLISPFATSKDFDTSSSYFLRMAASDIYDASRLSEYIKENYIENTTIAIFYTNSAYGEGIKELFEKEMNANNYKIVFSEAFNEGDRTFRSKLQKIKELAPKLLFIPGYYAEITTIIKEIHEIGLKTQIIGTSSFNDEKLLKNKRLKNAIENIVFTYPSFDIDNAKGDTLDFLKIYKKKFGINADIFAANSYDALILIDKAIEKKKKRTSLKEAIYSVDSFDGVSGFINFDKNGNILRNFDIYKVINGRTEKI